MIKKGLTKTILISLAILFSSGYTAYGSFNKQENKKELLNKAYSMQIPFIENIGQIRAENAGYYAKVKGGTVFITKDGEIIYSLSKSEGKKRVKGWVIKESFADASISKVKGEEKTQTKVNYLKGKDPSKWRKEISTYNLVSLGEVYKGVDIKLRASYKNVEKLFFVKPGASLKSIRVRLNGAKQVKVNEYGELELTTGPGVVKFTKPVAFQEEKGKRRYVEVAYMLKGGEYTFTTGDYDRTRELIIDPLLASTFISGNEDEGAESITIDQSGNVYVAGRTYSTDFPTTTGAYNTTHNGDGDAFIAKMDSNLSNLIASTLIGGSDLDMAESITIDENGNVYVAGVTASSDFPTTTNAYNTTHNGDGDAFIAKMDSTLQNLITSTLIGGSDLDRVESITLDQSGDVYGVGWTYSSDFPTTTNAYDTSHNGDADVFVLKTDSDLSNLLVSTFIGGIVFDRTESITLDPNGDVYVSGWTFSADFPTTTNAYDTSHNGDGDVFITKMDSTLQSLITSTFIGGAMNDFTLGITIDQSGNVYAAGVTSSADFPTTTNAYDTSHNGDGDVFAVRMDSDLSTLIASTFIGGSTSDVAESIIIDQSGNVYVAGYTFSADFPTTQGAFDRTFGDKNDAFVSMFDSDLSNLLVSTFIGGIDLDIATSITLDQSGNVYVAGYTFSFDFPTTLGAFDRTTDDANDAFVSMFDSDLSASTTPSPDISVSPADHDFGTINIESSSTPLEISLSNSGAAQLNISDMTLSDTTNFSLDVDGGSNPCGSTTHAIAPDGNCTVAITFIPSTTGTYNETLTIESDDPDTTLILVSLNGTGDDSGSGDGKRGSGGDDDDDDELCFIATAAFGSRIAQEVKILQEFRDTILIRNTAGRKFIGLYYRVSPPLADLIARHDTLQIMVRLCLLPLVCVCWFALHFGLAPLFGLTILLLALISFGRRQNSGVRSQKTEFRRENIECRIQESEDRIEERYASNNLLTSSS